MRTIIIFLAFILIIPACMQEQPSLVIHSASGDHQVKVEVVTRPDEQARGLMYRRSLEKESGMLFIFRKEEPQSFWMKNTLIPLDMIFISRDLVIVDITTMQPCTTDPCPGYTSRQPATYVLEVNAGYSRSRHIAIGDKVSSPIRGIIDI
jgi:uncharacterized membrane protein (UPF0127 family)